jgi:hypothetical protein
MVQLLFRPPRLQVTFLQLGEVADLEALTFNLSLNFI